MLGLRSGPLWGLVKAGLISLATAGIGFILAWTPLGASLEERFGLAWLFSLRGPVAVPDDVIVVGLDRQSAEKLGLPEKIRDWPRDLYADLITRLAAEEVPVIALDLILEREREPRRDAALVASIAEAERVVLFEAMELQRRPTPGAAHLPIGLLETQRLRSPIQALAGAAAGLGPFPLPIVPDRVSQVWLFMPGASGRPTLPAVALQQDALGIYDEWLALLKRAGAHELEALPRDEAALGGATNLRGVMIAFRQGFLADPSLGDRVRQAIDESDFDTQTRRLLGALVDLYEGPDSRYLNFYGPAGRVTTLSLADMVVETADPDLWKGRAVFIGQSELYEPHNDAFITVYTRDDGVKISGVEIAATAYANLLDGRMLEPSRYWLIAVTSFGLVIGAIAGLLPALFAVPACLAIAGLYFAGAEIAFAHEAIWLPTTIPLLAQLPLGLFIGLFVQYRDARRARENLSRAIRYYLPDKIAAGFDNALIDPLSTDEDAYAVCMITDAEGFTHLAEGMTSRKLKPFLVDYLEILFTTVEQHGGRVTDTVGDGITAAWTSQAPDPAIAAKACQAALTIDRAVHAFNQRHDPLRLPTRIGLNAGWVTLGHVGGAGRFAYTVVGDAVNTASRIEQLNKHLGTRILATRAVVEGLPDLALRPLGRFQLFGKEEVLEIVEVMDTVESSARSNYILSFVEALGAFEGKDWTTAATQFDSLSARIDDKAARLYHETCRRILSEGDPFIGTTPSISLSSK